MWLALWLMVAAALNYAWAKQGHGPSPYLFIWTNNIGVGNDFLATIDVQEHSPTFGKIVAKAEVDIKRGMAHHTEHEMSPAGTLFANLFRAGRTYLFDLHFDNVGRYSHPHTFVRLPEGRILSNFQESGHANTDPGGIVELSPTGEVVTVSPGSDPNYNGFCRPYSLAYSTQLDRIVTTCYDIHKSRSTQAIQIWRLSSLDLLKTIELPNGPRGIEGRESGEPRLLPDGVTFYVATFNCGLYRLKDLTTGTPQAELVYDDPHWMAREPYGRRIVITGGCPLKTDGLFGRVLIGSVGEDGNITLDPRLKDPATGKPGIRLDCASVHGAVFSLP